VIAGNIEAHGEYAMKTGAKDRHPCRITVAAADAQDGKACLQPARGGAIF